MPSEEDILGQQELLNAHRQTLTVLLRQQALHGEGYSLPAIVNGICETRNHIQRLKAVLREWGVPVTDHPNDEETAHLVDDSATILPRPATTHITQTAGDNAKQFGQVFGNISFDDD